MENQVTPSVAPVSPAAVRPVTPPVLPKTNSSKALIVFFFFIIFCTLSFYAGFQLGKMTQPSTKITQEIATAKPTETVTQTPQPTASPAAELRNYSNQALGLSLMYPAKLYLNSSDSNFGMVLFFDQSNNSEAPGSYSDAISVMKSSNTFEYGVLQTAPDGKNLTGLDLHTACGVAVQKIKNTKVGQFDAVEYIYDGTSPSADCGRDLIGYEHTYLIKKGDIYLKLINGSMKKETVVQHDPVFNQIVSSLVLN